MPVEMLAAQLLNYGAIKPENLPRRHSPETVVQRIVDSYIILEEIKLPNSELNIDSIDNFIQRNIAEIKNHPQSSQVIRYIYGYIERAITKNQGNEACSYAKNGEIVCRFNISEKLSMWIIVIKNSDDTLTFKISRETSKSITPPTYRNIS
jgi:hypothetical protein